MSATSSVRLTAALENRGPRREIGDLLLHRSLDGWTERGDERRYIDHALVSSLVTTLVRAMGATLVSSLATTATLTWSVSFSTATLGGSTHNSGDIRRTMVTSCFVG